VLPPTRCPLALVLVSCMATAPDPGNRARAGCAVCALSSTRHPGSLSAFSLPGLRPGSQTKAPRNRPRSCTKTIQKNFNAALLRFLSAFDRVGAEQVQVSDRRSCPCYPVIPSSLPSEGPSLRPFGRPCEQTTQRRNGEKSSRLQFARRPIQY